jgi:hypothetical protein
MILPPYRIIIIAVCVDKALRLPAWLPIVCYALPIQACQQTEVFEYKSLAHKTPVFICVYLWT